MQLLPQQPIKGYKFSFMLKSKNGDIRQVDIPANKETVINGIIQQLETHIGVQNQPVSEITILIGDKQDTWR